MTHHRAAACAAILSFGTALPAADKEVIDLSPFVVSSEGDEGYRASNTLSGTRMNTSSRRNFSTTSGPKTSATC